MAIGMHWLMNFTVAVFGTLGAIGVSAETFDGYLHASVCGVPKSQSQAWLAKDLLAGMPVHLNEAAKKFISANSGGATILIDKRTNTVRYSGLITRTGVMEVVNRMAGLPASQNAFIINSFGGDANAAITLSTALAKRGTRLEVDGFCASACANHLLGPRLPLRPVVGGLVLLHGSAQKCLESKGSLGHIKSLGLKQWWTLRQAAKQEGLTPRPATFEAALALSQRIDRGGGDSRPRSYLLIGSPLLEDMGAHVRRGVEIDLMMYIEWIAAQEKFSLLPMLYVGNSRELNELYSGGNR